MYIILDIVLIAIAILFIVSGSRKGFAKTMIEVIGYILAVMIAFSVAEYTADYAYRNIIRESIVSSVSEKTENINFGISEEFEKNIDTIWDSLPPYITAFSGVSGIDKDSISDYLKQSSNGVKSGVEIAESVSDEVVKPIVVSLIKFTVAILLIIFLLLLVKLLAKVIGKAVNLSLLKGINRFLGAIAGIVKGIVVIYILICLISYLLPIYDNNIFGITPSEISKTQIFKLFYNI